MSRRGRRSLACCPGSSALTASGSSRTASGAAPYEDAMASTSASTTARSRVRTQAESSDGLEPGLRFERARRQWSASLFGEDVRRLHREPVDLGPDRTDPLIFESKTVAEARVSWRGSRSSPPILTRWLRPVAPRLRTGRVARTTVRRAAGGRRSGRSGDPVRAPRPSDGVCADDDAGGRAGSHRREPLDLFEPDGTSPSMRSRRSSRRATCVSTLHVDCSMRPIGSGPPCGMAPWTTR